MHLNWEVSHFQLIGSHLPWGTQAWIDRGSREESSGSFSVQQSYTYIPLPNMQQPQSLLLLATHHLQCVWIWPWVKRVKRVLPGSPQTTAPHWSVGTLRLPSQFPSAKLGLPGWAGVPAWDRGLGQCGRTLPAALQPLHELSQTEGLFNSFKLTTHSKSRFFHSRSPGAMHVHPIPKPLLTPAGLPLAETRGAGGKFGWGTWAGPVVFLLLVVSVLLIVEPWEEINTFGSNFYCSKPTLLHSEE